MKAIYLQSATAAIVTAAGPTLRSCAGFPSSVETFTAGFHEPSPPMVKAQFNTSFIQHKWNANLSHITAGFIYNIPEQGQVLVDEAYEGSLAASVFNYANISQDGLVDNKVTTFPSNGDYSNPQIFRDYVNPAFPLLTDDLLVSSQAVYGGLTRRELVSGRVAKWHVLYQGAIPATVYVDACNVVVGYDFFAEGLRTNVITMFFNTQVA